MVATRCLSSNVGPLAAMAGLSLALPASPALAQPIGRLHVAAETGVFAGPNAAAHVKVFACPSDGAWSPAAGEFDVRASSGAWHHVSGGNVVFGDGSVHSINYSLPPAPAGLIPGPVQVWDGELRSNASTPRLVRIEADPSSMSVYPSPSAPPVPAVPTGSVTFVLDHPVAFGPALVAPAQGTSIQTGPGALTATPTGPEPVLIGLLLPAVQKIRDAAPPNPPDFSLTFQGQTTGAALPTEQVSLYYNQVPGAGAVGVHAAGGGDYTACAFGASGVLICLIEDEPTLDGLTVGRIPDTHMFEMDRDPKTGNVRTTATLEWDQPVEVSLGTVHAQTRRLRIASVNNNPAPTSFNTQGQGVVVIGSQSTSALTLSVEAPCRADLTTTAIANHPAYGEPDGRVNNDDFFYYLTQFAAGNLQDADMTTLAMPGTPGYAIPDGVLTNDDFFFFLSQLAAGC